TRRARESTSRCLLTAWRLTTASRLSSVVDAGPRAASLATTCRRVPSPSAAKSGAASVTRRAAPLRLDMAADVLHLLRPSPLVVAPGLVAPCCGQPIEARLDHREPCPFGDLFEPELHPV